jgi:hypothetical protein
MPSAYSSENHHGHPATMSKTPFIDAAAKEFAEDVIGRAQRNIGAQRTIKGKKRRRVSSGTLKDSLIFFTARSKFKTVLDFTVLDKVDAYAGVIEYGRKKGAKQPPTSAILAWMDQKRIRVQKPGGGFQKETPALRRSVAFLIARAIKRDGIEGIHYYRDAITDAIADAEPLFVAALGKEIELRTTLR